MKKAFFAILFFVSLTVTPFDHALYAQVNLVPNPSFEEYSSCPTAPGSVGNNQLEKAVHWYKPSPATTDYYNVCQVDISTGVNVPANWMGYQYAFHGNAYVGLVIYDSAFKQTAEYIQCKLLEPLEACKTYTIRFLTSLGDFSPVATNTIGARLDKTPIQKSGWDQFWAFNLPSHVGAPNFVTDTLNWVLVSGIYVAEGGEEYLTIGGFSRDTASQSYYTSSVAKILVPCNPCMNFGAPAYYYVDSVSVSLTDDLFPQENIPNIITANNDGVNDIWYPSQGCGGNWKCIIYNRWGNDVYTFSAGDVGWSGKNRSGYDLSDGVYYYCIYTNEKKAKTGFIHLVR